MADNRDEIPIGVEEKKSDTQTEEQKDETLVSKEHEDTVKESNPQEEEKPKATKPAKNSKFLEAKELIENSKELVSKVNREIQESKASVSQAAEAFDNAKRNFNNTTFKSAKILLEKLGYDYSSYDDLEPFELTIDKDGSEDFSVRDISSGKFTGFLLATLAALATVAGLVYFAISKLNIAIDLKSLTPQTATEHVEPILNWIGTLGGHTGGNSMVGAIILGVSALLVAWLVYAIRIFLKENKNLHVAKETLEKSKDYYATKKEHKQEMQKIDEHLREVTVEIDNFETILNEKVATLKRILHIEGAYDEEKEYHPSSRKTMRETEKIMQGIENLLNTAITKDGKLNSQSIQALENAKAIYTDYLSRIYD